MRDWGTDEWSTAAQIVAAVASLAAAFVALYTARQSRTAAESSAEAARVAQRALTLHDRPTGAVMAYVPVPGNYDLSGPPPTPLVGWRAGPLDEISTVDLIWTLPGGKQLPPMRSDGNQTERPLVGVPVVGWPPDYPSNDGLGLAAESVELLIRDRRGNAWRSLPQPGSMISHDRTIFSTIGWFELDFDLE